MSGGSSWQPHCARFGSAVLSSHRMICICFHNGPCKAVCFRTATTMYMYLKASRNIKVVDVLVADRPLQQRRAGRER